MKRPCIWILAFLIAGILFGEYGRAQYFFPFCFFLFGISIFLGIFLRRGEPLVFPLFSLIGYFLLQTAYLPYSLQAEVWAKNTEQVVITGTTEQAKEINDGYYAVILRSETIQAQGIVITQPIKIEIIILKTYEGEKLPEYGRRFVVSGKLLPFEEPTNPGGFFERRYYLARHISYKLFAEKVTKLDMADWTIMMGIRQLADSINAVYDAVFPAKEAGIVKAMVTGNKNGLDNELILLYQEGGIYHVLAISGLHISILAGFLQYLFTRIFHWSKRRAAVVTIALLLFYMVFTGCGISVVRTVVMWSVLLLGVILFREADGINSLSIAALLLLMYQPLYLWEVGFLLSFSSVFGILVGVPFFERQGLPELFCNTMGVSIAAFLFSTPVVIYFFQSVSLAGLFLNLLVLPLMSVVIAFSMVLGIIGLFSSKIAVFLAGTVYLTLSTLELLCRFADRIFQLIEPGHIGVVPIFLYYGTILCIFLCKGRKTLVIGTAAFLSAFLVAVLGNRFYFKVTEIAFLDVGQGDSAVITTYDKKTVIIDGGGNIRKGLGDNTGRNILMPYLLYQGIQTVDLVFISHMDRDHATGILELLYYDKIKVKAIVLSDCAIEETEDTRLLKKLAEMRKIPVYYMKAGDQFLLGEAGKIECLYPFAAEEAMIDANASSLVLRFTYGETSFLFTGDIGSSEEEKLLEKNIDFSADVLKTAHHGSKGSSSEAFLEKVDCETAVISCSAHNSYGHPAQETLQRMEEENIPYFITARNGAVLFYTNGKALWHFTMKKEQRNEGIESTNESGGF